MTLLFIGCFLAGIIFLGKVWGKIRPMIEVEKDGVTYHAGVSHSEKDHMVPLTKDDLEEGASFDPGDQAFAGLSNKSQLKLKFGELGNTKADFDERLLEAHPKLKSKVDQRSKP